MQSRTSSQQHWAGWLGLGVCTCLMLLAGQAAGNAVWGLELEAQQPNGEPIRVKVWGDEFYRVVESLDGYTLVRDDQSGFICYAALSGDGNNLVSTGQPVGTVEPATLGLTPHIRINKEAAAAKARAARASAAAAWPAVSEPGSAASPPIGNLQGLCLLVDFVDDPATIPVSEVESFCNQVGRTGGSVRDYFYDVSWGQFAYTNTVSSAYHRASQPKTYYNDESVSYGVRASELVLEALNALKATGFNFGPYDTDGDGNIDAVNVLYAGWRPGTWAAGLWPHASGVSFSAPGIASASYQMTDMQSTLSLNTFVHENGHLVCHWSDLYDYTYASTGAGAYCLMAYGRLPCAYFRYKAGWANVLELSGTQAGLSLTAGANTFYRLQRPGVPNEYFIIENRQPIGWDSGVLPDSGLAIWHIDTLGSNSYPQGTPTEHYEAALEQADGLLDLENGRNNGDAGDLWAGAGLTFGPSTTPGSAWWNGSPSTLTILNISNSGPTMTFAATVGLDSCLTSSTAWQNVPFPIQSGAFRAEFDLIPNVASIDGVVGLSAGARTAYAGFAAQVRFSPGGRLQARNGGNYMADIALTYVAGTTYHVRMEVDILSHRYSVYVTPAGGAEVRLANNYAFRTEQAGVTYLDNRAIISDPGTFELCDFAVETTFLGVHNLTQNRWYTRIQDAINEAANGDEIAAQAATYAENVQFGGKQVHLRSENPDDPAVVAATVIDGRQLGTVVTFAGTEGPQAVLSGLTIRNGRGYSGGGVSGNGCTAVIRKCTITGNSTQSEGSGGGLSRCNGSILDCTISNNTAYYAGGGLYQCNGTIAQCLVTGNAATFSEGDGGGLYGCAGTIQDCRITDNDATWWGGGIAFASGTVTRCVIIGNTSDGGGAGIAKSTAAIRDCLIAGNTANYWHPEKGAGLYSCSGPITHCTIVGNAVVSGSASGDGGGIWGCNGSIRNCIIWGNRINASFSQLGSSSTPDYSCVQDWAAGGTGNISNDPRFVDAEGPDGNPATCQDNDYHLRMASPCVNAADPDFVPAAGETDMDGDTRVYNSRADMGADELAFVPRVHNISQDTWHGTIQLAVNAAAAGNELVAYPATYRENIQVGKSLLLHSTDPGDPATVAATIIEAPQPAAAVDVSAELTIEGFTITHSSGVGGDGIVSRRGRIAGCVVRNNQGSGIRTASGPERLTVTGCTITGNSDGGISFGWDANGTISQCLIANNTTAGSGGGIAFGTSLSVMVNSCVIINNTAGQSGGGIHCQDSYLTICGCTIVGNAAPKGGGLSGFSASYTDYIRAYNCILWANKIAGADSQTLGSQIALDGTGARDTLTVSYGDIQYGQSALDAGSGNWLVVWSPGNKDEDPRFVDADGPDNNPATWQDNYYRLQGTSPCLNAAGNDLAAVRTDSTTAAGSTTTIAVADGSLYNIGDEIEYSGDGMLRTVTTVDTSAGTVTFDEALASASQAGKPVKSYGWGDMDGCDRVLLGTADMGAYERPLAGDVNGDGHVDVLDLLYLVDAFGTTRGDSGYNDACDFNYDGNVDVVDLLDLVYNFGQQ